MHKSGHLPPLFNHHYGRRHRQSLSKQRLSVVRTPQEDDIRPRPKVHLSLRPSPDTTTRSETEHINRLPPTDGRTVRKEESVGGTIPSLRNDRSTRRLERVVSNRLPCAQHSDQRHHQDGSNPGPPRVSPQIDGRRTLPIVQSESRRPSRTDGRAEKTGQNCPSPMRPDNAP